MASRLTSFIPKFGPINLPPRLRGGFIEDSVNYIRNVYTDYKTVYLETIQDIRNRPFRASIIGSILMSGAYCIRHNPTMDDFECQLVESNNHLSRVPEPIRNEKSLDYVHRMFLLNNKQLLRHQSFAFFSVLYRVEYSSNNDLFQNHCQYLKPSWRQTLENIVDVGFLDRFWVLDHQMKDYDINQHEWTSNIATS